MTPLDVVKIRLQAQTKGFVKGECFLYCNGLMDHVCTCLNGNGTAGSQAKLWRTPPQRLNGMIVRVVIQCLTIGTHVLNICNLYFHDKIADNM